MAMQSQLFSLNGLATELDYDRRSLAKWLDNLPPAKIDPDGTKRWRIRDVLNHIERRGEHPSEAREEMNRWIAQRLVPAIFGSPVFIKTFTGALRADIGLTTAQALRCYQLLFLAIACELERAIGPDVGIELPPLAQQLVDRGIAAVAEAWRVSRETGTPAEGDTEK